MYEVIEHLHWQFPVLVMRSCPSNITNSEEGTRNGDAIGFAVLKNGFRPRRVEGDCWDYSVARFVMFLWETMTALHPFQYTCHWNGLERTYKVFVLA